MKIHLVIDLIYHEEECHEWVVGQGSFGFEVVPMTKDEILTNNPPDV